MACLAECSQLDKSFSPRGTSIFSVFAIRSRMIGSMQAAGDLAVDEPLRPGLSRHFQLSSVWQYCRMQLHIRSQTAAPIVPCCDVRLTIVRSLTLYLITKTEKASHFLVSSARLCQVDEFPPDHVESRSFFRLPPSMQSSSSSL